MGRRVSAHILTPEQERGVDVPPPPRPSPPPPPPPEPVESQLIPLLSENLSPARPMDPLRPRTNVWFLPGATGSPRTGGGLAPASWAGRRSEQISHEPTATQCLLRNPPASAVSRGLLPPNQPPPAQSPHLCLSEVGGLTSTLISLVSPQPLTSLPF